MKLVDNIKNTNNDEAYVDYKFSVDDFDMVSSNIESEDDIDEKTIFFIERLVRNSFEYREYIKYLREELDLSKCSLLDNLDVKTTKVSLEFHHFPLTLFDITNAVARKMVNDAKTSNGVSTLDISEVVVKEHYLNNVGLVPVTKTIHEMAHNGAIIIPMKKVNGKYANFIKKYKMFIDPGILEKIAIQENNNDTDESKAYNKNKLSKKISKFNITYNSGVDEDVQEA